METNAPVDKPLQQKIKSYLVFFYDPKTGIYFTKVYKHKQSMMRARRNWWYMKSYIIEEWRNEETVKANNMDAYLENFPIYRMKRKEKELPF